MLRQKPELNIIYISERMRHSLQPRLPAAA